MSVSSSSLLTKLPQLPIFRDVLISRTHCYDSEEVPMNGLKQSRTWLSYLKAQVREFYIDIISQVLTACLV